MPLATNGQHEGYNYLGLGMILLLMLACYKGVRSCPSWQVVKPYTPLFLVCFLFSLVAVSNVVTLGPFVLFTVPLPESVQKVAEVFRGSGRFFWPMYYVLMFVTIAFLAARHRRTTVVSLLAITLAIQFFDGPQDKLSGRLFKSEVVWENPLQSEFWKQAAQRYRKILFVPQVHHAPNYGPFALLATNHGMAINVGYFARVPLQALQRSAAELLADFNEGQLDPDALYIVQDSGLVRSIKFVLNDTDGIGEVDRFTVIAPDWFKDHNCCENTVYLTRAIFPVLEPLRIGETIAFSHQGNGANYLLHGWSTPEEWGVWTDGSKAGIGFRPRFKERNAGDLLLLIEGQAFVSPKHPSLAIEVLANGSKLGVWQLVAGVEAGELVAKVPRALVPDDGNLRITFIIKDSVSPKELGISDDSRRLGFGLRKLSLVWGRR